MQRPTWNQIAKSGGLWAKTLDNAGYTCDRVPLAIDLDRCIQAKWCHTGCVYAAKNSVITNYLASAESLGVQVRPSSQVELITRSAATPYRYVVNVSEIDNDSADPTRAPTGNTTQIECKVLILAAGAMGTTPLLMRSRTTLPTVSGQVGKHLGVNGDHMAAIEYDEQKVRDVLGLPGYGQFYKGNHITTMSYDFWTSQPGNANDGKRFTLQEIYLSPLAHTLYDDGRDPSGEPSFYGLQKKQALSTFNNHVEILAMVEDTHDGEFLAPPPFGSHVRPNAGPVGVGTFKYELSDQSVRVREAADAAIRDIAQRSGIGRFMKLSMRSVFAAHPLGGCRMAESKDLGVVDHRNEVFDNAGLFCIDSSAIPTSLGVNPSLTISAVRSAPSRSSSTARPTTACPPSRRDSHRACPASTSVRTPLRCGAAATTRSTPRSAATASAGYEDAAAGARRPLDHCVTGRSCSSPSTSMSTRSLKNAR